MEAVLGAKVAAGATAAAVAAAGSVEMADAGSGPLG